MLEAMKASVICYITNTSYHTLWVDEKITTTCGVAKYVLTDLYVEFVSRAKKEKVASRSTDKHLGDKRQFQLVTFNFHIVFASKLIPHPFQIN